MACLVLAVGLWACGAGAMLRLPGGLGDLDWSGATIRRRRGGQKACGGAGTYLVLASRIVAVGCSPVTATVALLVGFCSSSSSAWSTSTGAVEHDTTVYWSWSGVAAQTHTLREEADR